MAASDLLAAILDAFIKAQIDHLNCDKANIGRGANMFSVILVLALHAAYPSTIKSTVDPNHELHVNLRFDARSFAAADLDRNGVLSLAEYLRAMDARIDAAIATNPAARAKIKSDTRLKIREKMSANFRALDSNADGRLSWQELPPDMKARTRR